MEGFTVKDWMTANPIIVASNITIPKAYWMMIDNKIRRLLVVDDDVLVGIVTINDLRQKIPYTAFAIDATKASDMLSNYPIDRVMSVNPITVACDDQLVDAATLMITKHISTLPVMDTNKLAGIITESDIFRAFVQIFEDINLP